MSGIYQALKGIYSFIVGIGGFVVKLFNDIVYVIKLISNSIIKIPGYLGFMPTAFITIFIIALCVILIYKVAGRD